jgi:6-pyruvoyltetrahydropterin/6-carboxytetrahydropterin synthase
VLARFDHRNLNADIPELAGVVATTENLTVVIGKALAEGWSMPARLDRVRVSETERNIFEMELR